MVSNEWGVPQFLSLISLMTSGFKTLRLQRSSQGFKTGHEKISGWHYVGMSIFYTDMCLLATECNVLKNE